MSEVTKRSARRGAHLTLAVAAATTICACSDSVEGETLFDTGLCVDRTCSQISAEAVEYEPRFELWASGASKRRWLSIPAGAKIDTSDPDKWVFPVGTKVWKEFTRDGVRVETRYISRVSTGDANSDGWYYAAYVWNATQSDTVLSSDMGTRDANGTKHDVPSAKDCRECHQQLRPSQLLGVEAMQLDHQSSKADLGDLIAKGWLSSPPSDSGPFYPLPGDATVQAAFGYLHANCGTCHSPTSNAGNDNFLDLRLLTTKRASVETMPTYLTTVNQPTLGEYFPGTIVRPRDPDNSVILNVMDLPQTERMPPIATEEVDSQGKQVLRAWINSL